MKSSMGEGDGAFALFSRPANLCNGDWLITSCTELMIKTIALVAVAILIEVLQMLGEPPYKAVPPSCLPEGNML